jgi:hypothetical protein
MPASRLTDLSLIYHFNAPLEDGALAFGRSTRLLSEETGNP